MAHSSKEITHIVSIDDIVIHCIDSCGAAKKIKIKLHIPEWFRSDVEISAEQQYEKEMLPFSRLEYIMRPSYTNFRMNATCVSAEFDVDEE